MKIKSKEFDDLKAEWYSKLKDLGFEDIEQSEAQLKEWSSKRLLRKSNGQYYQGNKLYWDASEEYYRQATWFLNDHRWHRYRNDPKKSFHKQIWQLHSEGISIRKIVEILKSQGIKISTTPVNNIILTYSKKMIKKYGVKDE